MGCCYKSLIGVPGVLERGADCHLGGDVGGSVPSAALAAGPTLASVLMVH